MSMHSHCIEQANDLRAENERLRETLAILKPEHAAEHYQCTKCDAKIQRWQDMQEYQHHGCGGLVRLIALIERDDARAECIAAKRDAYTKGELVRNADIVHIRLRDGLRRALEVIDAMPWICSACDAWETHAENARDLADELRKLLP